MTDQPEIPEQESLLGGSQFKRVALRIGGYLIAGFFVAVLLIQGYKIEIWANDRAYSKVDVGTTREQVVELFGEPPNVFLDLDGRWTFRYRVTPWVIEGPYPRTSWYFTFDQGGLTEKKRCDC